MYRIDNSTAANSLPTPDAVGVNPNSYFTKGNPSGGVPATIVNADWANAVQEEICYVIEQSGQTLSKTDRTQLLHAIKLFAQTDTANYVASTTAANTYTATLSPVPAGYVAGMFVFVKFSNHNTGAATINLNGLGAKSIVRLDSSALTGSEIKDSMIALLCYDGTNMQLVNMNIDFSLLSQYSYAADTGTANAYAVALSPVPAAYFTGMKVVAKITHANTTASTINVNSLGIKNIKLVDGTDPLANDLIVGQLANLYYDGTNFQLINPAARGVVTTRTVSAGGIASGGGDLSANRTITVTAAVQSDQETASSTSVAVVPGVQQFHPSASKAWVEYTSVTTTTKNIGYNIASLTDNGTGNTSINFTTSFSSANYAIAGVCGIGSGGQGSLCLINALTASYANILTVNSTTLATADSSLIGVSCHGDQ